MLQFIFIAASVVFILLIYIYYSEMFSYVQDDFKNVKECMVVYTNSSNENKFETWFLEYDENKNSYYFKIYSDNIIEDNRFVSKLEAINHLIDLKDSKIIKAFYIRIY